MVKAVPPGGLSTKGGDNVTGTEMREIRHAWGVTQSQFAKMLGLPFHSQVSRMETGGRPIRGTVERLLRLLNTQRTEEPK